MSDYAVKKIDEMEAIFLGGYKRARAELGVSAFGLQVIDLPPNYPDYPDHDHAEEGGRPDHQGGENEQHEADADRDGGGQIAAGATAYALCLSFRAALTGAALALWVVFVVGVQFGLVRVPGLRLLAGRRRLKVGVGILRRHARVVAGGVPGTRIEV